MERKEDNMVGKQSEKKSVVTLGVKELRRVRGGKSHLQDLTVNMGANKATPMLMFNKATPILMQFCANGAH